MRWKLFIDHRLDTILRKGIDSVPLTVKAVLEVAAYQLLFLDRVPAHAAIHEAVEHVRQLLPPGQARGLTGVVNATLRTIASSQSDRDRPARNAPRHPAPPDLASVSASGSLEKLAVATSHPAWLVARWLERFGREQAFAILAADNRRPGVHLRPRAGFVTAPELVDRLVAEGAPADLHPLHPACVVLRGGDPQTLAAYQEGLFAVQDVSAQIVGALVSEFMVEPRPGERGGLVVDLCAAPGGKAGAAAERPAGRIFLAADVSRVRLARVVANSRRQLLPLVPLVADARNLALRREADFVLADVPCLGTGTFRRRVDARWRKSPEQLPALVDLQRGILHNAADLIRPGGRLLYSTCSLEREENEEAVEHLLETRLDLRLLDLAPGVRSELRLPIGARPESALFITPAAGDTDGAFAALFERVA